MRRYKFLPRMQIIYKKIRLLTLLLTAFICIRSEFFVASVTPKTHYLYDYCAPSLVLTSGVISFT